VPTSDTVEQDECRDIASAHHFAHISQGSCSTRGIRLLHHVTCHCRRILPSLAVYYSLKVVIVPQSINTGYAYHNKGLSLLLLFFLTPVGKPRHTNRRKRDLDSDRMHSCWHVRKRGNQRKLCTQEGAGAMKFPLRFQGQCASRSQASTFLFTKVSS